MNKVLFIRWMKTKKYYTDLDNLFNTGIFKIMIFELLLMLVMPFPSLYNSVYYEYSLFLELHFILGLLMKKTLMLLSNGMTFFCASVSWSDSSFYSVCSWQWVLTQKPVPSAFVLSMDVMPTTTSHWKHLWRKTLIKYSESAFWSVYLWWATSWDCLREK